MDISEVKKGGYKMQNISSDTVNSGYIDGNRGLNVLIFGDSITDTVRITINKNKQTTAYNEVIPNNSYTDSNGNTVAFNMWPTLIRNKLDIKEMRNYAQSGASYKDDTRETGYERQNLSYQIDVAINDINNPNGVFPSSSFDPDIIIFALGTNDGIPNDTYESAMAKTVYDTDNKTINVDATLASLDRTKFNEAVRYAFLKIKQQFPYAMCFCVLPLQRADIDVDFDSLHDALKKMANRYGIIVIDGTYESGIIRELNTANGLGTYLKDGLHPNEKGQNLMAQMIVSAIRRYYVSFDGLNS